MRAYKHDNIPHKLIDEITEQVLLRLQEKYQDSEPDELLTELDVRRAVKNLVTGGAIALAPFMGLTGKASAQSTPTSIDSKIVAMTQKVAPGTVLDTVVGPIGQELVSDIGKPVPPGQRTALDNVHGILSSGAIEGDFAEVVGNKLKELRAKGYTPDVTDIQVKTTVSGGKVITTSSCKIIQSRDGKAYTIFASNGSAGLVGTDYIKRHDNQASGKEGRLINAFGGSAKKVGDTHKVSFTVNGKTYAYHQSFYVASTGEDDKISATFTDIQNPYAAPKDTIAAKPTGSITTPKPSTAKADTATTKATTPVQTPKPQTGTVKPATPVKADTAAAKPTGSTTTPKPSTAKADTVAAKPAVSKPSTGGGSPVKVQTPTPSKSDTVSVKSPAAKPAPAPSTTKVTTPSKPGGGSTTTVQTPVQNKIPSVDSGKSSVETSKSLSGTFTGSFTELSTRLEKEIKEALQEIGGGIITKYTPKVTKQGDGRLKFEVDWEVSKSDKGNFTHFIRGGLLTASPKNASSDIDQYLSNSASKLQASGYTSPTSVSNLNINLNIGDGYYWVEKVVMLNAPIKESVLSRKKILRLKVLAGIEKDYI